MIIVYSKDGCPQCDMAVKLLESRGIKYQVLKLGIDYTREYLLGNWPEVRQMPFIVEERAIGGLSDLQKYLNTL